MIELAKRALSFPSVFDTYQSLLGAPGCHQRFITEMVKPERGQRVLDVGCGVGASVAYLPAEVGYVGIDISQAYITRAARDYGSRGEFLCVDAATVDVGTLGRFDRAFAFGVLHHLSDEIAEKVVDLVSRVVRPGGYFVTIDPCYVPGQHWLSKFLIDNDRGEHVRDVDGFKKLVSRLGAVRTSTHHDLLRIPYTQLVMEARLS